MVSKSLESYYRHHEDNKKKGREYYQRNRDARLAAGKARKQKQYAENPEPFKERSRQRRQTNPDKVKQEQQEWYRNNRDVVLQNLHEYHLANKDERNAQTRQWRKDNPEKAAESSRRSRQRPEALERRRQYRLEKMAADPQFIARQRCRGRLNSALRQAGVRKTLHTMDLIGCSPQELKEHIEEQFVSGMSWENRYLWHVDHIRPCASFDLTNIEEQKKCFHYTNLRPMWASDNIRKGCKNAHDDA